MNDDSQDPKATETSTPTAEAQAQGSDLMARRQFVIRLTAYAVVAAGAGLGLRGVANAQPPAGVVDPPVSLHFEGTAEVQSSQGSTSFTIKGSLAYELFDDPTLPDGSDGIRFLELKLDGKRVSGPNIGPLKLDDAGVITGATKGPSFAASGAFSYNGPGPGAQVANGTLSGTIDPTTENITQLTIGAVVLNADGTTAIQTTGLGIGIPIGKNSDDDAFDPAG